MIYLIGGAARSGKTTLAHRLLAERSIPCLCTDYLVSTFEQACPELGIVSESPNILRAPRVWPRILPLLENIIQVEPVYTVEGDALWHAGAQQLALVYPGQVRACFLGYAHASPQQKLAEIRQFGSGVNDWIQKHTDSYILSLAVEMINYSQYLERECPRLGLVYIDLSKDFAGGLEHAYYSLPGAD